MDKVGIVKNIEGNYAMVEVRRVSACGENCSSCKGSCISTGIIIKAENNISAEVGQFVKLYMEEKKVLGAAFLVYIVPLIGLLLGLTLGLRFFSSLGSEGLQEAMATVLGLILLGITYIFINRIDRYVNKKNRMVVRIIEILL